MKLLVASDLSDRAHHALVRAKLLASQFGAELVVLHIVDEDLPAALRDMTLAGAREFLQGQLDAVQVDPLKTQLVVETGAPHSAIVEYSDAHQADLIIIGAHRRQFVKDVFTGTTAERVMRTSKTPILMVNTPPTERYAKVAVALDLTESSEQVLQAALSVGLFQKDVSVVHAYTPIAKTMMQYADVAQEAIDRHVIISHQEALNKLQELFHRPEFSTFHAKWFIEEGNASDVIQAFTRKMHPNLLVFGTHGRKGIKRLLLGSVADRLLREVDIDMFVVPV